MTVLSLQLNPERFTIRRFNGVWVLTTRTFLTQEEHEFGSLFDVFFHLCCLNER